METIQITERLAFENTSGDTMKIGQNRQDLYTAYDPAGAYSGGWSYAGAASIAGLWPDSSYRLVRIDGEPVLSAAELQTMLRERGAQAVDEYKARIQGLVAAVRAERQAPYKPRAGAAPAEGSRPGFALVSRVPSRPLTARKSFAHPDPRP